jgi:putative RNA 2'-phosphotransferase
MAKRNNRIRLENLSSMLAYMLGRRPYEFGIVPDSEGFVTYKELLQAFHEEPDWRHVRQSHINEVLLGQDRSLFEAEAKRIRALERKWTLNLDEPSAYPPKILFTPVRQKAHPVVMDKGLSPPPGRYVVLSQKHDMTLRIGRRKDKDPVTLEVLAGSAAGKGIQFYPFGELFLSFSIPSEFIAGPPVSRRLMEQLREAEAKKELIRPEPQQFTPGTFVLDPSRDPDPQRRAKGKKRKGWKEESRKMRRRKKG